MLMFAEDCKLDPYKKAHTTILSFKYSLRMLKLLTYSLFSIS